MAYIVAIGMLLSWLIADHYIHKKKYPLWKALAISMLYSWLFILVISVIIKFVIQPQV
jgi:hypothetical protein